MLASSLAEGREIPPTEKSNEVAELKRYHKKLEGNWFPQKSRDGQKMWLRNPDGSGKTTAISFNKGLWDIWVKNMTPVGKKAFDKDNSKPATVSQESPSSLVQYVSSKAEKEIPVVRNLLAKMSWFQNSLYDLGMLTFIKLSAAPGLLPADLWTFTLNDNPTVPEVQAAREKFAFSFEQGIDKLLRGLNYTYEIVKLERDLDLEAGRIVKLMDLVTFYKHRSDYFEQSLRIAQACMDAASLKEYLERLTMKGLSDAIERAEIGAANAQAPANEPAVDK